MNFESFKTLEREDGASKNILEKVNNSPELKKYFLILLASISLLISSEAKGSQLDSLKSKDQIEVLENNNESNLAKESLIDLVKFIQEKDKFKKTSYGVFYLELGKYDLEYFDKNKNDKFDEKDERFSLNFKNEKGDRISISFDGGNFYAIEISTNQQNGEEYIQLSKDDLIQKYHIAFRGISNDQKANVKKLGIKDIEEIINDIKNNL